MGAYANAIWPRPALHVRMMRFSRRLARGVARRAAPVVGMGRLLALRNSILALTPEPDASEIARVIAAPLRMNPASQPPRVVQVIGSLAGGGAERQLSLFAARAHELRLAHQTVLTLHEASGALGQNRPRLEAAGVEVRHAGAQGNAAVIAQITSNRQLRTRLAAIPASNAQYAGELAGEFIALEPDIVHAWLDHANIAAGIAAIAAGVPRVVLSLRSLNPERTPRFYAPWMRAWYAHLAADPRVQLVANSSAGAEDYAQWLGISARSIAVVHNGFDASSFVAPTRPELDALRASLAPNGRPLVIGVFRLSEEKQPLVFIEIARLLRERIPEARFAIAGDGPMFAEVAQAAARLGSTVTMLGARHDVPALLACADASMLCSRLEGNPNVLIESQALGCPVVATRAGGAVDAVIDGETGFLHDVGDAQRMAQSLARLISEPTLRASMSCAAAEFAHRRFGLDRMVKQTAALYR